MIFFFLYVTTLLINVAINTLALAVLDTMLGSVQLAFLIATAVSATMNFIGMKLLVFKKSLSDKTS